jgi:hypothetical protein
MCLNLASVCYVVNYVMFFETYTIGCVICEGEYSREEKLEDNTKGELDQTCWEVHCTHAANRVQEVIRCAFV